MTFFGRLKVLWLGFWNTTLNSGETRHHTLMAQGVIASHRQNLTRVRQALTNLIFQRKKLTDQVEDLVAELASLQRDVSQAAGENRDDLALNLMDRLEKVQEEHDFLSEQLSSVENDIKAAREVEVQLQRDIVHAEQIMGTLTSRYQALKVRRQLQAELLSISRSLNDGTAGKTRLPLYDQINRLEAELETMQVKREDWEKDWQKMRNDRRKNRHRQALERLKAEMRGNVLPAVVIQEPEPVH